jgi:hypothetical protein
MLETFDFLSLAPLITVDKSPKGNPIGKSTPSNTKPANRYQPSNEATSNKPAPTCCNFVPRATFPFPSWKNAAATHEKQGIKMSRIKKRTKFVRKAAMAKTVQRITIATSTKAKLDRNTGEVSPASGSVTGFAEYAA